MNRLMLFITVTFLGVFLVMSQAVAAGEGATDTTQKSTEPGATSSMESTESSIGTQAATHDFHRLSDFMDASVKGSQGEDLGSVRDVIISSDGQARYIVLSKGGVLGVGGDLIPVPFNVAQPFKGAEGEYTLNIDQQTLDQAPTVAENELQDTNMWEQEVRGYFGDQSGMQQDQGMTQKDQSGMQTDTQSDTQIDQPSTGQESGQGYNQQQ